MQLYQIHWWSSSGLLTTFLGFPVYSIMSSANSDGLTFSFPICISFIFFPLSDCCGLNFFNTVFNKSSESGHPCLILDLTRKAFSLSPLSRRLAVGLSNIAFMMFSYVPFVPTLLSFYHEWMLSFVSSFFCICWEDHDFYSSVC